jgi:ABC-type antimicrobial peptide transport system permease subunit
MLRALIYGLAILHLGPGVAFALLAFGCGQPGPLLGALCDSNPLSSFALLTAAAWVLMLVGLAAMYAVRRARYSRG